MSNKVERILQGRLSTILW